MVENKGTDRFEIYKMKGRESFKEAIPQGFSSTQAIQNTGCSDKNENMNINSTSDSVGKCGNQIPYIA